MKFCKKCNNMLYIQSEEETSEGALGLRHICKNCDYKEIDANPKRCIYENIYNQKSATHDIIQNKYIRYDPTLPRMNTVKCINPKCISNQQKLGSVLVLSNLTVYEGVNNNREKIITFAKGLPHCNVIEIDDDLAIIECPQEHCKETRAKLFEIHSFIDYYPKLESQIIIIKYDQEQLRFVYICEYCNTSWKK